MRVLSAFSGFLICWPAKLHDCASLCESPVGGIVKHAKAWYSTIFPAICTYTALLSWVKVLVPEVFKRSGPGAGMQDWLELDEMETQERPRSGGQVARNRKVGGQDQEVRWP